VIEKGRRKKEKGGGEGRDRPAPLGRRERGGISVTAFLSTYSYLPSGGGKEKEGKKRGEIGSTSPPPSRGEEKKKRDVADFFQLFKKERKRRTN